MFPVQVTRVFRLLAAENSETKNISKLISRIRKNRVTLFVIK